MKKTTIKLFSALMIAALSTLSVRAQDLYWDVNGAGIWDAGTTSDWSASSSGGSDVLWNTGDGNAIFTVTGLATNQFNVTVNGTVTVGNITQNIGHVRIMSGSSTPTIALSGTSTITTSTRTTADYDLRVDPIISGTGGIIKQGAGILLLENGANSFSGGITLNDGTLGLENVGANSVAGTGTLTLNGGNFVRSYSSGTLVTTNAINVTGSTIVGAYQAAQNWIIGGPWQAGSTSGNFNVTNITLNGLGMSSMSIVITNDISPYTGTFSQTSGNNRLRFGPATGSGGSITINGSNAKFATFGSTSSGAMIDLPDTYYGTFQMGELSGTGGWLHAGWATGGNTTFQIGALNTSTTYAGAIDDNTRAPGGHAAMTKVGTGSLTLSGPSTYSLATTIENGAVVAGANVSVTANGPFGNASSAIVLGDAASESANQNVALLVGGAFTMARPVTVGAGNATTATFTVGGNSANNSTISGALTLNQNLVVTQAVGGTVTISGAIGSGSQTVTKVGGGTAILSGANSYTGSTVVSNGVLMVANTTQGNGPVTVVDGAAAGVSAASDATYWWPSTLTVGTTTGGTLQFGVFGPNNTLLVPGSLTLNGTTTINISSAPMVNNVSYPLFNGYTTGALALGSQPGGVFGKLTVSGGTVYYAVTNLAPTVWTAKVNTNWDTTTANWTNIVGGNLYAPNSIVQFDDSAIGAGPLLVNVTPATVAPASITVSNTAKGYVIGGLAISGSTTLTKNGDNTLTLTGTNTFTGNTTIYGGTLEIAGGGQLGGGSYSANIDDETTLKVNTTAAQTLSGTISGNGALIQANTGTLTLSGGNTYYGATTISNGSVVVANNSALGYGTVTLAGGLLICDSTSRTINNTVQALSGTSSTIDANNSFTLNGGLTGGGTITRGSVVLASVFLGADNSGFTGVYQDQNSANSVTRWNSASAGSANARWIFNQAQVASRTTANFGTGTIYFGSISGAGYFSQNVSGTATVEVGALGLNDTFAGSIQNGSGVIALNKVGAGTLTLSGANTFTGGLNINGGVLSVSNASAINVSVPISFGGGTLQFTPVNQVDYSAHISNSTAPISIDVNGTNVTFAAALPSSNTGGLALTNSTGTGVLMLTANNLFTGSTLINAGTLALSGSGNIGASTNITVVGGATYDVSGVTSYTLGGSQTLSGSGTVTGAVTTAGNGSTIIPGGAGTVGTLTFNNNLILGGGATPMFDLTTSHLSGNDQVVVAGNMTMSSADTIHINALGGSANLDQTADYVLFSVAGTTTMTTRPLLVFDNAQPGNFNHYTVTTNGNNVVLHYSLTTAPVIVSVVVTNTADGSTVGTRGQSATVYVTVQPGTGSVTNVNANLSQLGGSASQTLASLGGNNYAYTFLLGPGATVGYDTVNVTVIDSTPLTVIGSANFTINSLSETWNGQGTNNNWSSGSNWVSTLPPGYAGDAVIFTGSARTTPNLETNYNVTSLTFDNSGGTAGSFTIGSTTGKSLTLSGALNSYSLNNYSGSAQVLNVPFVINGPQYIYDAGSGLTLAGNVSGSGVDLLGGILTLAGANTYTGNTTIDGGTLLIGSSAAIPSGVGAGNVTVSGTLDLNGTNASVNGLNGYGTVDNTGANAATLSIGNGDAASAFSGSIQNSSGPLTLVKVGANVLALNAGNSFGGGLIISNGTVTMGNSGAAGSGTVTLSGGTLNNSAGITLANNLVISGSGSAIQLAIANNLTLNGGLSGSGALKLGDDSHNGSVYLGMANSMTSGTITFANNVNSVRFSTTAAGSTAVAFVFNNPTANKDTLDFGADTISFGSFTGSGTLRGNSAGVHTISAGALGLNDVFSGTLVDQTGQIALTKVGTGTLTLTGANTYTGNTTISNGTLIVSTLATGGGNYTAVDGATLGVSVVSSGSLKVASLAFGNSTNAFIGLSSTVNPAITNTGALTLAGTVRVNVSGVISVGQYPLIASASIGGTGGFVIGTLPWGSAANILTNGGNTIVLNVTTGSALVFEWTGLNNTNWDLATANNWNSNGVSSVYSDGQGVQFDDSSTQTNVAIAVNVAPSSVLVTNSTRNYTFAGSGGITGSASLTKSGNGTLTLANSNSYSGGTVINSGTLQLGDGVANNGAVAGNITDNGSLVIANPYASTLAAIVSGTGSLVQTGAGALTVSGSNTYTNGTVLEAGSVILPNGSISAFGLGSVTLSNVTVTVQPGGGSSYNSASSCYLGNNLVVPAGTTSTINDSVNAYGNLWVGGDGVQWIGSGTLNFQNSSSVPAAALLWNGNTLANFHGTLNIGATGSGTMYVGIGYNSSNGGTGASVATFDASGTACTLDNAGSTLCQVVDANCTTVRFGSLAAGNSATVLRGNSSNPTTIEVGALNTSSTFAGAITDSGSTGTLLTKVGLGTLTLSGANTYSGLTTVSNGTLLVNGSIASAVTVNGGTLGGTGAVGGAVTVNSGGTLAPGTSAIGTLAVNNNLTLSGNTLVKLQKGLAQSNDVVNVSGTLHYGGTLTVDNLGSALVAGDSFRIFPTGGTGSVTVSGSAGAGLSFGFSNGLLSVISSGPSGSDQLTNSITGGGATLSLSWGSGWTLQRQTNSLSKGLGTNWQTYVAGNASITSTNISIDKTNGAVFYRLSY